MSASLAPESAIDWPVMRLEEVVDVLDHKRIPVNRKEREQRPGDIPYYGATGQAGWIDDYLFDEQLVLLGEDGISFLDPLAQKAYIVEGKSWVNNHAHVLRPREGVMTTEFLKHALDALDYTGYVNGTTRLKLTKSSMLRLPLVVPDIDDQVAISANLSSRLGEVLSAEANLQSAVNGLVAFRAACLAAAFSGELLGVEPESRELRDIAYVQSGIAKGRPADGAALELPYIRTANVQAGYLDLAEVKTLVVNEQQASKHRLQHEDVLVLEGGDADKVGRGWLWESAVEDCLHQNHVFAVRTDRDVLDPRYVAYFINAPQARKYFLACAKQTTNLASINKGQLNAFPVPVLSLDVQREVVALLDECMEAATAQQKSFEAQFRDARLLRRALLDAALSGALTHNKTRAVPSGE